MNSETQQTTPNREIVVIGPAPPYRGGIAQFLDGLVTQLAPQHDVTVLSFKLQYPRLLFPGKEQKDGTSLSTPVEIRTMLNSANPLNWHKCGWWLYVENPGVVLVNHWMPYFAPAYGYMLRVLKKRRPSKIILICHNLTPHEPSRMDDLLTRYVLNAADAYLVMSEEVERELLRFNPEANFRQTPLPLNETFPDPPSRTAARETLGLAADAKVLLFFGLVREYKGLDILIEALSVIKSMAGLQLIIAGEFYQDQRLYRRQINTLGLADQVRIIPEFIPKEKAGLYFAAADVVVLPYKTATQSGITKMAYRFDRPVIVTDAGGLPQEVEPGRTGLIARANDSTSLAQKIEQFFTMNADTDFAAQVRDFKKRFSWSHFNSVLTELIESIPR